MRVIFRPMLVSGMVATSDAGVLVLIDSEQPDAEQLVALWHEALHLLGLRDEDQVEAFAQRLAQACPEILPAVRAAAARPYCPKCDWSGDRAELLDGEACPRCRLVL